MRLLLDTHILPWAGFEPERLSAAAATLLKDAANEPFFSVVSLWELTIKRASRSTDAIGDPRLLRRLALANGYSELLLSADHAFAVRSLPPIHRDPFNRVLVAQATVEGMTLVTGDATLACCPGPIRKV